MPLLYLYTSHDITRGIDINIDFDIVCLVYDLISFHTFLSNTIERFWNSDDWSDFPRYINQPVVSFYFLFFRLPIPKKIKSKNLDQI